jgi:HEAT repeat protein
MTDTAPLADLIAQLADLDKNARLRAVMALGQGADVAALPALLERLRAEPDFFVRDNLSWAIARCGETAVLPLIALLNDAEPGVRYQAAHALSKLGDPRAIVALMARLHDDDHDVLQKAIYALGRLRAEPALPLLAAQIGAGTREHRTTRNEALEAFGVIAVPHVEMMLTHDDVLVRVETTEVLGAIGGDAAAPALARAATDHAWEVRFAALNALRGATHPTARAAMHASMTDAHAHVRALATRLLQEMA